MTTHHVKYGGERLDRIAKATMLTERNGTVEAILDNNVGLAARLVNFTVPGESDVEVPATRIAAPAARFVLAWE